MLFDQDLISKWGALDFLGCVNANATSLQYAIQQGKQSPPQPYALGTSPASRATTPSTRPCRSRSSRAAHSQSNINDYCSITRANALYVNTYLILGQSLSNQSACTELPYQTMTQASQNGVLQLFNSNGTKMNAVIQESQYLGVQDIQNTPYVLFLVIYLPDANGTVQNAPSEFYNSNFYRGFFTGQLPGFRQVYPNYTAGHELRQLHRPVRIYEVVNYTGGTAGGAPKPAWITNNDVMP